MDRGIPARLTAREGRRFGFTVGAAFAILAGIAWWRGATVSGKVFGALGGALLLAAAVIPARLGPVQRGWMAFARLLSRVTTPVFMALVYFLVITPIALFRRAIGRQPMRHAEKDGSLWIPAPSGGRSDMKRQF